jgi:hypothetical protein
MRRQTLLTILASGLLGLMIAGTAAQERPAADAAPGAPGTSGVPLGSIDPVAAPGSRLQIVELTW